MSSVIAIAKKKSKSNDNVAHFAAPASSGIVQGDLPASKKFQGDLPADIKAQILKIAFSDRITLENLQSTACRLALVLCKEDMKTCLQMFVPRSLGFIKFVVQWQFPGQYRVETRSPISKGWITEQILSSEHWEAEESPMSRASYEHGGLPPFYLVPTTVDHDSFGTQCVNVLTKLYPKLTFAYERKVRLEGDKREDYIHVMCDGIRCNIPVHSNCSSPRASTPSCLGRSPQSSSRARPARLHSKPIWMLYA